MLNCVPFAASVDVHLLQVRPDPNVADMLTLCVLNTAAVAGVSPLFDAVPLSVMVTVPTPVLAFNVSV